MRRRRRPRRNIPPAAILPQDALGARYGSQDSWADEQPLHDEEDGAAGLQHDEHGNELDEDFFADEDDLEQDHDRLPAPKSGRKKLIAAALVGAIAVGGGGAYLYKSVEGRRRRNGNSRSPRR